MSESRERRLLCASPAYVGDPVSVVSGAATDIVLDFQISGHPPLSWNRYYDSSQNGKCFSLGWGHSHEYDRLLRFDLDGLRYEGPAGETIPFPYLTREGDQAAAKGFLLSRIGPKQFRMAGSGTPSMDFVFDDSRVPARLVRLGEGDSAIAVLHDHDGRIARFELPDGRRIQVNYNVGGLVTAVVRLGSQNVDERVLVTYQYDRAGNLVEGIDSYKNRFRFEYDHENRMVRKVDRCGYSFHYTYDSRGRCILSTGEDGVHHVQLKYLTPEPATVVTRGDGGEWKYFFDPRGPVTLILDPYGGARTFVLDDAGLVVEEKDPDGNSIPWIRDSTGGLLGMKVPPGRFERPGKPNFLPVPHQGMFVPSELPSRVPPVVALDTQDCHADYEVGRLLTYSGAREILMHALEIRELPPAARERLRRDLSFTKPREREYDELGHLFRESRPGCAPRRWVYDANGNVVRYTDHDGATRRHEYASWNLRSASIDPLGNATRFSYSHTERLTSRIDPRGVATEYHYDLKDRLVRALHEGQVRDTYQYDPADLLTGKGGSSEAPLLVLQPAPGRLITSRRLASGETHEFAYDEQGRFRQLTGAAGTVSFAYDRFGNRIEDLRDGRGIQRTFRGLRFAQTELFGSFRTTYSPTAEGLVIRDPSGAEHRLRILSSGIVHRKMSNGTEEVAQYDRRGLCVLKVCTRPGAGEPWIREFDYSGEGDLLAARDNRQEATTCTYDAAHRLTEASGPFGRQTFAYDASDNLISLSGVDLSYPAGSLRAAAAGAEKLQYDSRGNCIARTDGGRKTVHTFDSLDQLVGIAGPDLEWEASYDPLGRRVLKRVNGDVTEYFWDGDQLVAELTASRFRIYVYADDYALVPLLLVDYPDPSADPSTGQRAFVFADHRGSPVRLEDDAGAVAWEGVHEPYGATTEAIKTGSLSLRMPGHYLDRETGLHYNRFRYYDPRLGRYLQPDPVGISSGRNVYAYPASPLARVDVNGLGCPDEELSPEKQKELDEKFGAEKGPFMVKPHEFDANGNVKENPTLIILKPGEQLKEPLPPGFYIWVIDGCGNTRIAAEPTIGTDASGKPQKLGHPTLQGGGQPQPGRIGGELIVGPDGNATMNDGSGRYTTPYKPDGDRGQTQLNNAQQQMLDSGIPVTSAEPRKF